MKLGFGVAVLAAAVLLGCNPRPVPVREAPPEVLRVATMNVHYILLEQAEGPWSVGGWEARKGPLDAAFKAVDADVFAFQEMESFRRGDEGTVNLARDWLLAQNPGYAAGATGDPAVFPSTQPIFYRRDRLELVDQGWFFFSETPDVIYSRTYNGGFPAFASWAQFRDGDRLFRVLNVHNDYASRSNRIRSSELIAERIRPWLEAGERVVVLGDFNSLRIGSAVRIVAEEGIDFVPVRGATYHLNRGIGLFGAIDHIGLSAGVRLVGETQVIRQKFGAVWPSDHYPVLGDVLLE